MSYVTTQKVGKHTYLIECTGYRNDEKKPRSKRRYIGYVDEATGNKVYKESYITECRAKGIELSNPTDIRDFQPKIPQKVGLHIA